MRRIFDDVRDCNGLVGFRLLPMMIAEGKRKKDRGISKKERVNVDGNVVRDAIHLDVEDLKCN